MNHKPLVSGIITFLNAEKFIEEAIESVFAQTYDHWELLLVDDGSTDGSTAIALKYAQQYPDKVRYLEHEGHQNHGTSAARNLGIHHTKGEYIAFLDADDVWLPPKLEQQVAILGSQPEAAMVYGRSQTWFSWTGNPEDIQCDHLPELGVQPNTLVQPPTLLPLILEGKAVTPCPSDILIRRGAIKSIGGFEEDFRDMYQHCEDQAFFTKVFFKVPVFVASQCWNKYRQHPDSCSSVIEKAGAEHSVWQFYLNWLENYLSKQESKDTEVWKILEGELWPYRHPTLYRLLRLSQSPVRQIKGLVKQIGRRTLPAPIYYWLRAKWQGQEYRPPVGWVNFGSLRRVMPISRVFGFDRGLPVDRYYIENFLARYADDIRGRVLEIADATYTQQFGSDRVTQSDVLHIEEGNPEATIVGDLTCADHIPSDTFDCIILTQTLHLIYDVPAALKTLYRILKPGGILLTTFPGISQIDRDEWHDYWYWSFTTLSAGHLFEEAFPAAEVQVEAHGNVLAAISYLHGLATHELHQAELDHRDPDYEVLITVRAVKPEGKFGDQMIGKWDYQIAGQFAYGDDTTYKKSMAFLDGHGSIEDWGCGAAYAKLFVKQSKYTGVDGSQGTFTDQVVDLREYTSKTDCILMRHVLEHNHNWSNILANAINSFNKRMVLIIFTPFADQTQQIDNWSGIPDISFRKEDLIEFFKHLKYTEESLKTDTQYKTEHIFYIEK